METWEAHESQTASATMICKMRCSSRSRRVPLGSRFDSGNESTGCAFYGQVVCEAVSFVCSSAMLCEQSTRDRGGCRVAFLLGAESAAYSIGFSKVNCPAHGYRCLLSTDTSRCRPQDSRPRWSRFLLPSRTLSFPTTCRFYPGALRVAEHTD